MPMMWGTSQGSVNLGRFGAPQIRPLSNKLSYPTADFEVLSHETFPQLVRGAAHTKDWQ